jgi:hypothetical protein
VEEPPVGGVGRVRDEREGVEAHRAGADHGAQLPHQQRAQRGRALHVGAEGLQRAPALAQHVEDPRLPAGVRLHQREVLLDVGEEAAAAPARRDQLLEEVRVAAVDEQLAEEPVQEAGAPAGDAAFPQLLEVPPHPFAQQERHRLPVAGGGVVEGDLAERGGLVHGGGLGGEKLQKHLSCRGPASH